MIPPHLTIPALHDLQDIREELSARAGVSVANRMSERLFQAIQELARLTPLGHKHQDIDLPGVLCQVSSPYVIVFRREPRVVVLRVVHGARNISKLHI